MLITRGLLLILVFSFILLNACKKDDLKEVPECIQNKITELETSPVRNPPAKIYSYTYNSDIVYYIPPYCCDVYGDLLDDECNLICHPDGGIAEEGDGTCTEFFDTRTNEKLIWEDER